MCTWKRRKDLLRFLNICSRLLGRTCLLARLKRLWFARAGYSRPILVAGTDTLIAMNHANAAVAAAMLDLLSYRLGVVEIEGDIAIVNASLKSIEQFQNEIREEARAVNAGPISVDSVNRMKSLNERFDATWQRYQEETHKLGVLTEDHARRLRLLLQRSMAVGLDVQTAIRSALLAARSELGG